MPEEEKQHLKFVKDIAQALVMEPDAVEVEDSMDERGVFIKLWVAKDDLGRIIGKKGKTAESIRTLLHCLGSKNGANYGFKVDGR